jgi:DNA-binding transcriptional MerR regulator
VPKSSLDEPQFNAAQVAKLAETDVISIHTWTTRGLTDPHRAESDVRRGRGRQRLYSLRDALRFYLMARLHKQYGTPLPVGKKICETVFGATFNEKNAAFLILEKTTIQVRNTLWCKDAHAVGRALALRPLGTVIHTRKILREVSEHAKYLLEQGVPS